MSGEKIETSHIATGVELYYDSIVFQLRKLSTFAKNFQSHGKTYEYLYFHVWPVYVRLNEFYSNDNITVCVYFYDFLLKSPVFLTVNWFDLIFAFWEVKFFVLNVAIYPWTLILSWNRNRKAWNILHINYDSVAVYELYIYVLTFLSPTWFAVFIKRV